MRIFDSLRGHFALLTNRELHTLSKGAPFVVTRVVSTSERQGDWTVVIRPIKGTSTNSIYISDILRVYARRIDQWGKWITLQNIRKVIKTSGINLTQASYIMALMATFDDIESRPGEKAAIRYILPEKKYGQPVE